MNGAQKLPRWEKTADGYTLVDGPLPATLRKVCGAWFCKVAGVDHRIGKRASFVHADLLVQDAVASLPN